MSSPDTNLDLVPGEWGRHPLVTDDLAAAFEEAT